jgi:hypothetical protein
MSMIRGVKKAALPKVKRVKYKPPECSHPAEKLVYMHSDSIPDQNGIRHKIFYCNGCGRPVGGYNENYKPTIIHLMFPTRTEEDFE